MFKKKKVNKSIMSEFYSFRCDEDLIIKKAYSEIKNWYEEKSDKEELDIDYEIIRIKRELGLFSNHYFGSLKSMYIPISIALLIIVVEKILGILEHQLEGVIGTSLTAILCLIVIFTLVCNIIKDYKEEKLKCEDNVLMLNISLEVLMNLKDRISNKETKEYIYTVKRKSIFTK